MSPGLFLVAPSPLLTSGGHHWRLVQTCLLEDLTPSPPRKPPLALTSSGGHRNTYRWKAGGTHPTVGDYCAVHRLYSPTLGDRPGLLILTRHKQDCWPLLGIYCIDRGNVWSLQ